jgi:hypothetical protein
MRRSIKLKLKLEDCEISVVYFPLLMNAISLAECARGPNIVHKEINRVVCIVP